MHPMKATSIADRFSEKTYQKNEFYLTEGKICNEYLFLCKGFMRAFTYNLEGDDITTAFYQEHGVACEIYSLFKRVPARENIQALTDCQVLYINFEQLQQAFHSIPEFREFGRSILVNAYAQLKQRMLALHQLTAEQRYSDLIRSNPAIFQIAPLKTIATYLGITDTSLSRIRKEYAKNS